MKHINVSGMEVFGFITFFGKKQVEKKLKDAKGNGKGHVKKQTNRATIIFMLVYDCSIRTNKYCN